LEGMRSGEVVVVQQFDGHDSAPFGPKLGGNESKQPPGPKSPLAFRRPKEKEEKKV